MVPYLEDAEHHRLWIAEALGQGLLTQQVADNFQVGRSRQLEAVARAAEAAGAAGEGALGVAAAADLHQEAHCVVLAEVVAVSGRHKDRGPGRP